MLAPAETLDHLLQVWNFRKPLLQLGQAQLGNLQFDAEHALRIGVVHDDGLQVARPAHVELEAPATGLGGGVESGHGIFPYPSIIVLTAVRDDLAIGEGLR